MTFPRDLVLEALEYAGQALGHPCHLHQTVESSWCCCWEERHVASLPSIDVVSLTCAEQGVTMGTQRLLELLTAYLWAQGPLGHASQVYWISLSPFWTRCALGLS